MKKYNWNLSKLIQNFNGDFIENEKKNISEACSKFKDKWESDRRWLENPRVLRDALDHYDSIYEKNGVEGRSSLYVYLLYCLDQNDEKIKAQLNKLDSFAKKEIEKIRFFFHSLMKMKIEDKNRVLESKEIEPYRHFLEMLFSRGDHILSKREEKILMITSDNAIGNWIKLTSSLLSKEEVKIKNKNRSFSEIVSLMDDRDKKTRDIATKAFNNILEKWIDVAEAELNNVLNYKKEIDELRNYPRPDTSRHLSDDIESSVVDTLRESVKEWFFLSKEFYKLKAKILGVKKLKYNERNLEIGDIKEYEFDSETSISIVRDVLQKLDPQYSKIFNNFIENEQIDFFPKKGKMGGAFCLSDRRENPIYILLNHTNKLKDVLTLAHEVGHGIHFELAKKQNSLNFGASLATAEVASTFIESFVFDYLYEKVDEETRFILLMSKLNDEVSTIIRQIACYEFEQDLHLNYREKGYLSKAEIGQIFQKNMSEYMGPSVSQDKGSQNWWIYWSHIRNFFYVYSYASGLLISKSLKSSVKEDSKFIEKVTIFFESGESKSPKTIFSELGIDIDSKEFWVKGLKEIQKDLNEAKELSKQLGY